MNYQMTFTVSSPSRARALAAAAHVIENDSGWTSAEPITDEHYLALLYALARFLISDKNQTFKHASPSRRENLSEAIVVCRNMADRIAKILNETMPDEEEPQ